MGNLPRSTNGRNLNYSMKVFLSTFVGVLFGFFVGVSVPAVSFSKFNFSSSFLPASGLDILGGQKAGTLTKETPASLSNDKESGISPAPSPPVNNTFEIWVPSNPHGAEMLPPGILATQSDLYLRRLFGNPEEDLTSRPRYLVTFTVGYRQKHNIDEAVKKFSDNFTIVLFHYDGQTTEWDEFEWSKRAIHVSVRKQTKWWYAKRFLHPDIIAAYDYIFIWDEDLGVEHFDAEEYLKLMKKHGLEVSQPALEPNNKLVWQMTKKRDGVEVHKATEEKPGRCRDPRLPPCAGFIEIMAPVFTRDAWRCVWHMLQNDLVHGWGLDFALRRCVEPAHEKIGVIDAQWVVHQSLPSLGEQGEAYQGKEAWRAVRERCREEWFVFERRMNNAENTYFKSIGIDPSKFRKP